MPPSGFLRARAVVFPAITNLWPLLLFVSQKAFALPALLLLGAGDSAYRRDLVLAALASGIGLIVYSTQLSNVFAQAHLVGFMLFVWSVPTINYAVRFDAIALRRLLTWLTLFNTAMGLFLLVSHVDLYGLRGLNRVVGTDGVTSRVYFESASLAAVALVTTFKQRWLQLATIIAVFVFTIIIARSVAIVVLLGLNLALPYILRSTPIAKVLTVVLAISAFYVLYLYLPVLRPDVELSLRVKQFQFDIILGSLNADGSGWGWGAFLPALASDPEQPYQIEMQLPMLLLQLGWPALLAMLGLFFSMFISAANSRTIFAIARFAIFTLIGFNNPWLFLPSWFLTCQLLFRYENYDR
jgi:hypothetical protein